MKIPFFSSGNNSKEHFFGLLLKENKGVGYIISGDGQKLQYVAKKEFNYSDHFEHLTEDVDEVLFKLENETKYRVEKTIFFLYSHLVDDKVKEIKKPLLLKIKEITQNLEIKPIGYIECYEAVASFLQAKEGMPLTSILIELDDHSVDVFVYKGGHKMHNSVVSRTDNIIDDLHTIFDKVGENTLLPNRLLLYNSSHLVEESTKIISHKWSPELFVQLPRVEVLHEEQIAQGLLQVFEGQMYQELKAQEVKEERQMPEEVMGFMIGQDIGKMQQDISTDVFPSSFPSKLSMLEKVQKFTQGIKVPRMNFSLHKGILFTFFCFFALCLTIVLSEYYLHKATVSVFFPSVAIKKDTTIVGSVDKVEANLLTLHVATFSSEMKDVRITTGKRDIGEKATGEVTLYNFDDKDKTFAKGTILQVDNTQFTLDDDVKVASSTLASDASAKLPGKSKAKVTAVDLGPESNLDKGKRFKIADLPSSIYFAMNDAGFTGGTRKTIKTVSKKDMEDLKVSLLQKAKDQEKAEIYQTKAQHVTLIDDLIDSTLSNVVFSKELGEEGDSLSLQAKILVSYYYFDTNELNSLLVQQVASEIPADYQLKDVNIHFKMTSVKKNKSDITLKLAMDGKATKKIDTTQILDKIRLKTVTSTQEFLKTNYQASSSTVQVTPQLILIKDILPLFKKNIIIHIESL